MLKDYEAGARTFHIDVDAPYERLKLFNRKLLIQEDQAENELLDDFEPEDLKLFGVRDNSKRASVIIKEKEKIEENLKEDEEKEELIEKPKEIQKEEKRTRRIR